MPARSAAKKAASKAAPKTDPKLGARPIVIALTIERGGFGAEAAAPAVCNMFARWFHPNSADTGKDCAIGKVADR